MTTAASIWAKLLLDRTDYNKGLEGAKKDTKTFTDSGSKGLGGLSQAFEKTTGFSLGTAGAVGILAVGVQKTVKFLGECEQAANEANMVMAKQEAILKATGYAAGLSAKELSDMAQVSSKLTGIDDELIANSQSVLLTFRNIGESEFPRAQQAALDLQTTFGDLNTSSMMLGKALNDPIKGITALGKAGVTFSDAQKEQIKYFAETNQLAKAQAIILAEVERQVGGTAAAMEAASDGSDRLKVAAENLKEAIGAKLTPVTREWNIALAKTMELLAQTPYQRSITAIKALGGASLETATSYEQYYLARYEAAVQDQQIADWMLGPGAKAGIIALRSGKDLTQMNWLQKTSLDYLASSNKWLSEYQFNLVKSTDKASDALKNHGDYVDRVRRAIENNTPLQELPQTMEDIAEAVSKANKGMLDMAGSFTGIEETYNEKYKSNMEERFELETRKKELLRQGYSAESEQIKDIDKKLANNTLEAKKNADEKALAMHKVVLGYIEQQLAVDGLSTTETEFLLQKGVEWGIYSETAIEEMKAVQAEWNGFVPGEKTASFYINTYHNDIYGSSESYARNTALLNAKNATRKALGGTTIADQMYQVNEGGVPEMLTVNNKQYLMMGSTNGEVTPLSSAGESGKIVDPTKRSDSALIDYDRLGMIFENAVRKVVG